MDIVTLNKQIRDKQLSKFYVFCGEDISLQNFYLEKMGNIVRVDTVAEVWTKLKNKKSLFKQAEQSVFVVRDDMDFINNSKLEELIDSIKNNTLILSITTIKKNTKAYKVLKPYMVEFATLTTNQLMQTVQNICPMDTTKAQRFIEGCDNNYGVILSELDKVKYGGMAVIDEVIASSITFNTFTLIDMIFKKDPNTVKYLVNLLDNEENAELGLLTLIFNKASELLQLQQSITPQGMNDWVGKKMLQNNKLNQRELYRATRWAKLYIEGIKNGEYTQYDAAILCVMKII